MTLRVIANVLRNRFYWSEKSTTTTTKMRTVRAFPLLWKANFHGSSWYLMPKVVPYILSDIGEGIVEVIVKEWYVNPGDKVAQFDPVCEVQSDKASVTITSRFDGEVGKLHCDVEAIAKVGMPLLDIILPDDGAPSISGDATDSYDAQEVSSGDGERYMRDKALATPAVRRIARENKVNLSQVPATGKEGRVLKEDIISFIEKSGANSTESGKQGVIAPSTANPQLLRQDWIIPLGAVKKAMAKTMTEAWSIPHFCYADEMDVTELISVRKQMKVDTTSGVKVTYLPFILKAVSMALLRYPALNAKLNDACSELTVFTGHNLGVAVDTPAGLLVPCIKNVQDMTVFQIAQELQRLQKLGQQGRLTREDLSGGTLTISNIGAIGGVHASPIILPPQIAIGALGKIQRLPRYDAKGNLVPKDLMMVSWSADHRAVDGATIAKFSNLCKQYVASPSLLLQL